MGAGRGTDVFSILTELDLSEQSLSRAWAAAQFLATNGALNDQTRRAVMAQRDAVFAFQQTVYNTIQRVLRPIGQGDAIPAPRAFPDLPPASGPAQPAGVMTDGLGIAPAVIWAAAVVGILIHLAAIYAVVRVIQIGADTVRQMYAIRENTKRLDLHTRSQQQRWQSCLAQTQDPARCTNLFPLPDPVLEDTTAHLPLDPVLLGVGIVSAILSLGVVGYVFWEFSSSTRGASAPSRIIGGKGNPQLLSGTKVSRQLRGDDDDDYGMYEDD